MTLLRREQAQELASAAGALSSLAPPLLGPEQNTTRAEQGNGIEACGWQGQGPEKV